MHLIFQGKVINDNEIACTCCWWQQDHAQNQQDQTACLLANQWQLGFPGWNACLNVKEQSFKDKAIDLGMNKSNFM